MSFPRLMRKGLTFENVTFSYPGADRPALSRVSLSIKPGERLALVGPNGAGKSTLIKLLLGLYRPDEGRITVDGIDMGDLNMEDRRRAMAAVFQDYATFSLTVRENIALSALEQIDNTEAIIRAAQEGGAHSFVEQLNLGYDTPLGKLVKGSHEPSEGQWQRLAISRGLMRDAEILILDEPTASLDPMAEVGLYRHFTQLLKGRTVILVTHRLGSARMTDRIAVLHEGQVVETGSHDELIKASGTYAEMFESQAEWYREGEVS